MTVAVHPDLIASLVQKEYDALPAKRKPAVRDNGIHEWVPLSGIVAQGNDDKLYCLSLSTGMKCLPSSKLQQAQGNVLHDWHAEVLAIRAFNRFLLEECRQLALGGADVTSPFLRRRTAEEISAGSCGDFLGGAGSNSNGERDSCNNWHAQPFAWREDVALHMYCSEAPCGDASMELTMAAQTDASPWDVPSPPLPSSPGIGTSLPPTSSHEPTTPIPTLPGRAYFSLLGAVRRKPARGDAPPTLSKSCSDKLALKQCTSLLSSTAALHVSPEAVYLRTLILPTAQYDKVGCRRAFGGAGQVGAERGGEESGERGEVKEKEGGGVGGRMAALTSRTWPGGYAFHAFEVHTTDLEFAFSRREVARQVTTTKTGGNGKTAASNLAVAWTAGPTSISTSTATATATATAIKGGLEETTLSGTLQGRRQFDARGASFASRRRMWGLAAEVAGLFVPVLAADEKDSEASSAMLVEIQRVLTGTGRTYGEVKECGLLTPRRKVKEDVRMEVLKVWVRNQGDDGFCL